jgi:acetamidase/formamidase
VLTTPGFGLLYEEETIDHPFTRITPIEGDTVVFEGIEVDIRPVIGTIGVAPAEESYTTLVPHDHGGNLDTTDITAGTTAYFPVFQDGAMLAMGDAKAVMADEEMYGTGAEVGTEIDITVDVIDDPAIPIRRPLIETDESWKTIASARTVESGQASQLRHVRATRGRTRVRDRRRLPPLESRRRSGGQPGRRSAGDGTERHPEGLPLEPVSTSPTACRLIDGSSPLHLSVGVRSPGA